MHRPTYFILMAIPVVMGMVGALHLWEINRFLFWMSVYVTMINLAIGMTKKFDADGTVLCLTIASVFTIPLFVLSCGLIVKSQEIQDPIFGLLNTPAPAHVLPGKSSDYDAWVNSLLLSSFYPMFAGAVAFLVGVGIFLWQRWRGIN